MYTLIHAVLARVINVTSAINFVAWH